MNLVSLMNLVSSYSLLGVPASIICIPALPCSSAQYELPSGMLGTLLIKLFMLCPVSRMHVCFLCFSILGPQNVSNKQVFDSEFLMVLLPT